jgi:hypothetical protein
MRSGDIAPPLLTSALDEGDWSASRPCRFIPEELPPDTHWIEGRVGPRVGLEAIKIFPVTTRNRTPAVHPVAIPTEISRLLT